MSSALLRSCCSHCGCSSLVGDVGPARTVASSSATADYQVTSATAAAAAAITPAATATTAASTTSVATAATAAATNVASLIL